MNILSIQSTTKTKTKTKMPTFFNITLTFECVHCDYQCETKDEKRAKLLKRLHMKKCSAVGRTIPKRTPQDIIDARDKRNGLHVGNSGGKRKKTQSQTTQNTAREIEDVPSSKASFGLRKERHYTQIGEKDGVNYHDLTSKGHIGKHRPLTPKQKKGITEWRQVQDKKARGSRGGRTHTQEVYVTDRMTEAEVKSLSMKGGVAQTQSLSMKGRKKDTRAQYVSLLSE